MQTFEELIKNKNLKGTANLYFFFLSLGEDWKAETLERNRAEEKRRIHNQMWAFHLRFSLF